MDDELPRLPGAGRREAGDQLRETIRKAVHKVDVRHVKHRDAGQHHLGPLAAGPGDGGDADDRVPGRAQRGAQDGTHPARPDDTDPEPPGPARDVTGPVRLPVRTGGHTGRG